MQPSEEIKQKLDIVDVLREYIQLKPAGMNFRALCPFHREKTPSFMVSPDKQIWHCFGCGKGGDIFSFVMEMEGIDFPEALRLLAPKAGVTLRRQDPKLRSERNQILDILELSRKFYHKVLMESPAAEAAREYLSGRGLKDDTLMEWQVGYSPDSWDTTLKFLQEKGFKSDGILKSGMAVRSDTGNRVYDRFRGRIMFPINDLAGNTVAFSARVSPHKEAEEKMGKYINSPQTVVYDKSKIIFGLDKAKTGIKANDLAIIVEGQMDVISAHQAGWRNVVASSGTALTLDQITILKRYSNNIALAFDMDEAGAMAADRGVRAAMREAVNIKIITLPAGKDPDECIRKDPAGWEQAVENAKPMMRHYFDITLADLDLGQTEDKRRAAQKLLPMIAGLGDRIEQDHWLKTLGERLEVSEAVLRETISRNVKPPEGPSQPENQGQPKAGTGQARRREERMSELLLALVLRFSRHLSYLINNIQVEQIQGQENRLLYKNLVSYYNNIISSQQRSESDDLADLLYSDFQTWLKNQEKEAKDQEEGRLIALLNRLAFVGDEEYQELTAESAKQEIIKIVAYLRRADISLRMRETEKLIAEAEQKQDRDAVKSLMEELKYLGEELQGLK